MSTRPSLRHGLPYGWWRSADLWATVISVFLLLVINVGLFGAYLFDWKAWW